MNFFYILMLFLVLLCLSEIMAILLKVTGLDIEKARFQVISIITHTGFTTRESELIAQHPTRRKIVSYLMLISYVSQATFFSILISSIKDNGFMFFLLIFISITLIIVCIIKSSRILIKLEPFLDRFISNRLLKSLNNKSIENVLYINDEYEVIELIIKPSNSLLNKPLKELNLSYIKILLIDKGNSIIPVPKGNDYLEEGDRIIAYGKVDKLKELNQ